jgi:hypothetical protein
MELKLPVRYRIAQAFGIAKKGPTHVDSNVIVSDGYSIKEIENALNIDAMQAYLETKEQDPSKLWDMLIAKIEGREVPTLSPPTQIAPTDEVIQPPVKAPKILPEVKKKRGRPAKK